MRIDLHVHAGWRGFTPEALRREYQTLGVSRGVCQSADFTKVGRLCRTAAEHPDTVGWLFCSPAELIDRGASRDEVIE